MTIVIIIIIIVIHRNYYYYYYYIEIVIVCVSQKKCLQRAQQSVLIQSQCRIITKSAIGSRKIGKKEPIFKYRSLVWSKLVGHNQLERVKRAAL